MAARDPSSQSRVVVTAPLCVARWQPAGAAGRRRLGRDDQRGDGASNKNYDVTAFARNLTNLTTKTSGVVNTLILGTPAQGAVAPPRTFGLVASYHW